jgi:hypothetical protein
VDAKTPVTEASKPPTEPRPPPTVIKSPEFLGAEKSKQFDAAFPPLPTSTTQPATGIVRSVSDYKTSELAGEVQSRVSLRKSRTDVFHQSPGECLICYGSFCKTNLDDLYKGMRDIDEAMHFADENGSYSESFYFNDRAPLVQLQEICSAASIDANSDSVQQKEPEVKIL